MSQPAEVVRKPQQMSTPTAPSRMTLQSLTKGRLQQPVRVVLYGVEGVGKSTFGSGAPAPIYLGAEDGTAQLDVTRFPKPESLEEALDAVRTLIREEHDFRTLVVDTLDWLEPLIWQHTVEAARSKDISTIEDFGYGKGYVAAMDHWRRFVKALEVLRSAKQMNVVLIAHSWIKAFKNPQGEDFDRYEMKLHAKAAGLMKEWADAVLFCDFETFSKTDARTKRVRGVDTGARVIHTERRAAYDAKNRYQVEAKKGIKKRLGSSPDHGDALVICLWDPPEGFGRLVRIPGL